MIDGLIASPPDPYCPKCGLADGFAGATPHYDDGRRGPDTYGEWLVWTCRQCGYRQVTRVVVPRPMEGVPWRSE